MRRQLAFAVMALAVSLNAARALPDVWRQRPFGVVAGAAPGDLRLQDFASHLGMARLAVAPLWGGGPPHSGSIYTVEAHLGMTRAWTGRDVPVALPFGYSPTMVWVLAPLTPFDDATAYLLWSLAGLGLLAWLLWPREDTPVVAGLIFLSPLSIHAFALGQTALYSCAVLLLLARPDVTPGPRPRWRPLLDAGLLWLLTAKPPVALMAGAALLAVGRWRAVGLAVGLTLVTTALVHPLLGPGWASDYLAMARAYNSEEAHPAFAWCLYPTYMSNLRAGLWALGLSDPAACLVSAALWAAATAAVMAAGLFRRLAPWGAWCLALLAFLTLSPHVNLTEDLHLYAGAVVAFAATRGTASRLDRLLPALFVGCALAANLLRAEPALRRAAEGLGLAVSELTPLWMWPPLAAKLAVAGVVLWRAGGHRAAVEPPRRA